MQLLNFQIHNVITKPVHFNKNYDQKHTGKSIETLQFTIIVITSN